MCGNRSTDGSLQVLGCSGPNLRGHDLLQVFRMLQAPVINVNTTGEQMPFVVADDVDVDRLLAEFADLLGLIKGPLERRFWAKGRHGTCASGSGSET